MTRRDNNDDEIEDQRQMVRRSNDLSRATLPLPMAWTIMVAIVFLCGFVYRMDAKVEKLADRYEQREKHDAQLAIERAKNDEMLKKYLEDQITIAGLRNAAMAAYAQKGR